MKLNIRIVNEHLVGYQLLVIEEPVLNESIYPKLLKVATHQGLGRVITI